MKKEYETKCDNLKGLASGAKRDNNKGKGAYELISPFALKRLADVYERGINKKRGARDWENGIPFSRCIQSGMRHINQYKMGMQDEDHLGQACFNIFSIMHYEECIKLGLLPKELDDLPKYLQKPMLNKIEDGKSFKKNKHQKLELYLAHPFDARKEIRKWEKRIEKQTGINLINPFYDITRKDIEPIDMGRAERYEKLDENEIIPRDINIIKTKDGVIAIINGALSYGTIQEMVYAKLYNKLVYSLITNEHENHPWLKYHSTKIFTKQEELDKFLIGLAKNNV